MTCQNEPMFFITAIVAAMCLLYIVIIAVRSLFDGMTQK